MAQTARPTSSSPLPSLARNLARFMGWWQGELAALVPAALRQWWQGSGNTLVLDFADGRGVFHRTVAGRREEILSIDAGGDLASQRLAVERQLSRAVGKDFRLLIGLPAAQVLRRTIALPLAVEENLRQALGFELDRYTPFKADQVYFDFRILERNPALRQLKVELAVVQRSAADLLAGRAASLGLPAAGAVIAGQTPGEGHCFSFSAATAASGKTALRSWRRAGLALFAALLLALFLAIPIWQKRAAAISLLAPLDQARAAARETDGLRDRLDQVVKDYRFLIDMKWGTPSTLLVLEEVSKLLPDDSFITQLDFDGKSLQLQGESASAATLVEALEASPVFKEVGFKAQVTKIQGTTNDRFHISAALEGSALPKPLPRPPAAPAGATAAAPSEAAPPAAAEAVHKP